MSDRKTSEFDRSLAAVIYVARRKKLYTQALLAEKLGISTQQLQKYESARNRYSVDTFRRVAQILELDISETFKLAETLMEPAGAPQYVIYRKAPKE